MDESILESIRKLIGGAALAEGEVGPFDTDLIMHINTVLQILNQLGVGRKNFHITGTDEIWGQFLSGKTFRNLHMVKTYVYMKVRMMFDPPASGTLMQAMKENIAELENRINIEVDRGKEE
jgi:hypothetical protein